MFFKIGVLKNISSFTGKHCVGVSFRCNCRSSGFIKERLRHRCFPMKFAKFSRTRWWLLLKVWEMSLLSKPYKGFLTNENIAIKHKDKIVTDNSKLTHLFNNHYINIVENTSGMPPKNIENLECKQLKNH